MKFNLYKKGIGMVEAIAAISILITGIISVVSLAQSNLATSQGVEARMTAINLAREGFEAVRIIRDSNWLKGKTAESGTDCGDPSDEATCLAWDYGLDGSGDSSAIAKLDVDTLEWSLDFAPNQFTDDNTRLSLAQSNNLYRQPSESGDQGTNYWRILELYAICYSTTTDSDGNLVFLNEISNDTASCSTGVKVGIHIISKVQWQEAGKSLGVAVEGSLYNWRFSYVPYEP